MPIRKPAVAKTTKKDEAPKPVKPKGKATKPGIETDPPKEVSKVKKSATSEAHAPAPTRTEAPVPKPARSTPSSRKPKPAKTTGAEPVPVKQAQVPAVEPAPPPSGLDSKAQAVLDALRQGCALEFIFENGDVNPPRTFEPRLLCFDALSKAWYAWGWDRRYNAERHHRLDLLKELNPVEGLGRAAQGPFKEGTPANLIGGWLGGEPIPVKAVLMKQWIFAVKQAPPAFPSFQMEDIEDGKAQVTFVATDLRAIARWCMQFGDGIQVLEPQRLVDRIKQAGIAWGGKPRQEAEPPRPTPPPQQPPPPRQTAAPSHPKREREPKREAEPKREMDENPKGKAPRVEVRTERL